MSELYDEDPQAPRPSGRLRVLTASALVVDTATSPVFTGSVEVSLSSDLSSDFLLQPAAAPSESESPNRTKCGVSFMTSSAWGLAGSSHAVGEAEGRLSIAV